MANLQNLSALAVEGDHLLPLYERHQNLKASLDGYNRFIESLLYRIEICQARGTTNYDTDHEYRLLCQNYIATDHLRGQSQIQFDQIHQQLTGMQRIHIVKCGQEVAVFAEHAKKWIQNEPYNPDRVPLGYRYLHNGGEPLDNLILPPQQVYVQPQDPPQDRLDELNNHRLGSNWRWDVIQGDRGHRDYDYFLYSGWPGFAGWLIDFYCSGREYWFIFFLRRFLGDPSRMIYFVTRCGQNLVEDVLSTGCVAPGHRGGIKARAVCEPDSFTSPFSGFFMDVTDETDEGTEIELRFYLNSKDVCIFFEDELRRLGVNRPPRLPEDPLGQRDNEMYEWYMDGKETMLSPAFVAYCAYGFENQSVASTRILHEEP